MINKKDIKKGHYYLFTYTNADNLVFSAMVKIIGAYGAADIRGKALSISENTLEWNASVLGLSFGTFLDELTRDKNPEYFL